MKNILSTFLLMITVLFSALPANADNRVIMLTGFWTPTNEMLREFSQNPAQNPGGWKGANWENSGFDVKAFFPEFPPGSGEVGTGDFRVDYASVTADHAKYTALLNPIALIGFGQDEGADPWTVEENFPDQWNGTGYVGYSTLPELAIQNAVNQDLGIGTAVINWNGNPGTYLCAFIAKLNARYAERHSSPDDPARVLAAGFIHVNTDVPTAIRATEDTLRALIADLKTRQ